MSRQSEAKERQGYTPKAIPKVCMNCTHYRSEIVTTKYGGIEEKSKLCEIGDFKVMKMGSCNEFLAEESL